MALRRVMATALVLALAAAAAILLASAQSGTMLNCIGSGPNGFANLSSLTLTQAVNAGGIGTTTTPPGFCVFLDYNDGNIWGFGTSEVLTNQGYTITDFASCQNAAVAFAASNGGSGSGPQSFCCSTFNLCNYPGLSPSYEQILNTFTVKTPSATLLSLPVGNIDTVVPVSPYKDCLIEPAGSSYLSGYLIEPYFSIEPQCCPLTGLLTLYRETGSDEDVTVCMLRNCQGVFSPIASYVQLNDSLTCVALTSCYQSAEPEQTLIFQGSQYLGPPEPLSSVSKKRTTGGSTPLKDAFVGNPAGSQPTGYQPAYNVNFGTEPFGCVALGTGNNETCTVPAPGCSFMTVISEYFYDPDSSDCFYKCFAAADIVPTSH